MDKVTRYRARRCGSTARRHPHGARSTRARERSSRRHLDVPSNLWSFLYCILREPRVVREARWFMTAGGVFSLIIAILCTIAFVLRPAESQAVLATLISVAWRPST